MISDAAIDLLDQTESENIRVTATAPAPDREAPDGEAREPLAGAIRVGGRVVNLSASGLAIDVASDATQREGMSRIVDPDFEGPFPLAGLTCTPVSTQRTPRGHRIKMTSQELPTPVEKEIVRGVYEHQLQAAGGRGRSTPEAEPPDDDDLPTS